MSIPVDCCARRGLRSHPRRDNSHTQSNLSYKFKIASASPISFDSFSAVETSGDALLRAHAVLMILAWMAFVPVAMMMPRYFKGRWDHQVSLALCNRSKLHGLLNFLTNF